MTTQTYRAASRRLLEQGLVELERGNLPQASKKGWEAAEQMLKGVAERRGWERQGYRQIRVVANRLASETGDKEMFRLYRTASDMHVNGCEGVDTPEDVAVGLDDVGRLLDKLDRIP